MSSSITERGPRKRTDQFRHPGPFAENHTAADDGKQQLEQASYHGSSDENLEQERKEQKERRKNSKIKPLVTDWLVRSFQPHKATSGREGRVWGGVCVGECGGCWRGRRRVREGGRGGGKNKKKDRRKVREK